MLQHGQQYLPLLLVEFRFHSDEEYEMDHYDLYDVRSPQQVFGTFGNALKIINLGKSRYYVQFEKLDQALKAKAKLHNFYIRELNASITITLCKEDPALAPPVELPLDSFRCLFEVRVPLEQFFDHEAKMKGIQGYNLDRVRELADRDFFHGEVRVEYLPETDLRFDELDRSVACRVMRIEVCSNKLEKFNLASKLVHELAANVQEDFKRFCYREQKNVAHIFKILRIDLTRTALALEFHNDAEPA